MHGRLACLLFLLSTLAFAGEPAVGDDTLGAAQALLLWQVSSNRISPTSSMHFSVSIDGHDLPQPVVENLRRSTGIMFAPGSMFKAEANAVGKSWKIHIGKPALRADGNYELTWGYYCGSLCASSNTAILHHDSAGWHVIDSQLRWVS